MSDKLKVIKEGYLKVKVLEFRPNEDTYENIKNHDDGWYIIQQDEKNGWSSQLYLLKNQSVYPGLLENGIENDVIDIPNYTTKDVERTSKGGVTFSPVQSIMPVNDVLRIIAVTQKPELAKELITQ